MALKAVLTKAEYDALPEALRAANVYVEQDGKFVLDWTDDDTHPKVSGLKSALAKERTEKETSAKEFRKLKEQVGDLDPEKARAALAKLDEMAAKKLLDEGQIDEYVRTKTQAMKADHDNQVTAFKKQLEDASGTIKTQGSKLKDLLLNGSIRQKAIEKGVKPVMADDVVARFTIIGVDGIRWDLDGDNIVAKRGDQVAYGKDASKPMSLDEGFELLQTKIPDYFQPSTGGGAGNGTKTGTNGAHVISAADAKIPAKYNAAREAATKVGADLQITE